MYHIMQKFAIYFVSLTVIFAMLNPYTLGVKLFKRSLVRRLSFSLAGGNPLGDANHSQDVLMTGLNEDQVDPKVYFISLLGVIECLMANMKIGYFRESCLVQRSSGRSSEAKI